MALLNAPRARIDARLLLPVATFVILLGAIFWLQPRTMSYFGLNLMLNLAVPLALATIAQMMFLTINDLDLSIGSFVGLVACITATWLHDRPWLGVLALLGCIAGYAAVGALVQWRQLPSIVVTLGLSFVWLGLAILLLPSPGGNAPDWLSTAVGFHMPLVPLPIVASVVIGLFTHVLMMRTSFGVVLRGMGGFARAVERAGWSALRARMTLYALAGCFGVLSGLALVGLTTSADANIAQRYTLLSVAGSILGGCSFFGGRIAPIGTVIGALTLALASSALTFLHLGADWQVGAQGAILIAVLALRALTGREREA